MQVVNWVQHALIGRLRTALQFLILVYLRRQLEVIVLVVNCLEEV